MGAQGFKIVPAFSSQDVERMVNKFADNYQKKILQILIRSGEYFVKYARENGKYKDRTGNLRSSIGYVVVDQGSIVMKSSFKAERVMAATDLTDGDAKPKVISIGREGSKKGEDFVNSLVKDYPNGMVLIGVAGMEYASYVERIHSLDVITGAAIKTQDFLKRTMLSIKAKM